METKGIRRILDIYETKTMNNWEKDIWKTIQQKLKEEKSYEKIYWDAINYKNKNNQNYESKRTNKRTTKH